MVIILLSHLLSVGERNSLDFGRERCSCTCKDRLRKDSSVSGSVYDWQSKQPVTLSIPMLKDIHYILTGSLFSSDMLFL